MPTRARPAGSEVVRAPCRRQKLQAQARSGRSRGSCSVSSTIAMFPQWHVPSSLMASMIIPNWRRSSKRLAASEARADAGARDRCLEWSAQGRSRDQLGSAFAQERDEGVIVEAAEWAAGIGIACWQWPGGGLDRAVGDRPSAAEGGDLPGVDADRGAPGKEIHAAEEDALAGRRILPWPDGDPTEGGEVGEGAGRAAEIARERADVVPTAADKLERARRGQAVAHPARPVQVDARGRQLERLAPVRLPIRALAGHALVAGPGRHLIPPAVEGRDGRLNCPRGQPPPSAPSTTPPSRSPVAGSGSPA